MKGIAMSRRSYRERNGIGSTAEHTTWTRPDPDPAAIARLETELADTRAALNLARERAEDAEADLEEARLERSDGGACVLELDQFHSAPAILLRTAPRQPPTRPGSRAPPSPPSPPS